MTTHGAVAIESTAAGALDVAAGAEFGSGNVPLVGADGKINGPLSSTILDNLSGDNLIGPPSGLPFPVSTNPGNIPRGQFRYLGKEEQWR